MIPSVGKRALGSQYFLHEQIGRGGMGTVWRGEDQTTGASYAIKVLNQSYAADPEAVARFVRERTALISFRHPHVVQLHDMIVERDTLALVMDLIPGGDLNRLRRDHGGRLDPGHAAELTAQVADALAAAHAAGIVHRDVKPANILLRTDDDALLADFGIAQLAAASGDTPTGLVLGTAEYLAPELIAGGDPGPEGDLYSLGVTLYQLVAGAPPFTGHPAAVLHAHVTDPPPRPAGMDDGLWEVVSGCLQKDPARRPAAVALAAALRRLTPGTQPIRAPLAGPVRDQYGLSSPLHQVRMQPLSQATEQPEAKPRRSLPSPSRTVMAITGAAVAGVALIAAVVIMNPFASSAAKSTSDQLTTPTVTSGATAAAAVSARPSRTGTGKKQGDPAKGSGTQTATATASGRSTKPGSHPSSSATSPSSGPRPTTGGPTTSAAPSPSGTPDADGFTILNASDQGGARNCEQLGIDRRGYQAIVCYEIDSYTFGGGEYEATGKVEAYCQTISGASAQCLQITLGGLFTEGVSGTENQQSWSCGGSAAACPDGPLVETLTTFAWSDSKSAACNNGTSPGNDVWDEVVGGTTQIELPVSEATYALNSSDGGNDGDNYSSGHYWVCQS
jgi:serine/threonine-protein kinase